MKISELSDQEFQAILNQKMVEVTCPICGTKSSTYNPEATLRGCYRIHEDMTRRKDQKH